MAGNPANVSSRLWAEADFLIYRAATLPADDIPEAVTDPFVTGVGKWEFLGLLVGDAGIEQSRQWDSTDIPAWGYGTIIVADKDFSHTTTVSALEDNPATQEIIWPGSTDTSIVVPHALHAWFAIEKRTAAGGINRLISKMPGRFWCETVSDAEGTASPREIEVRVFPNSNKELYSAQKAA
ncbi:major tail subunit [Mycobacterium phage Weirdo19]|uniref:Major tail subunit n=1 Tax=Mycobacterium phage Weirdo19 TaxID=2601610 RepID=A0A6M2YSU5_9CAUD|nr:major tail subunit [Mycobacterium phage Weirdo19]QEA10780.1 major tail subunit [Mycobacterium phage Weirdo19]